MHVHTFTGINTSKAQARWSLPPAIVLVFSSSGDFRPASAFEVLHELRVDQGVYTPPGLGAAI